MSAVGEQGFTLLEMLVTLAIMALVAGIGFPVLSGAIAARALGDGAGDAVAALGAARARARAQGVAATVLPGAVAMPPAVAVDWPAHGITFWPDGSASGGAVVVRDARGARRIVVDPGTGRIEAVP